MIERRRRDGKRFVAGSLASAARLWLRDDAQHRLRIGAVAGKGAALGGDLGRGRIGAPGEDGAQGAADRPAESRVVRNARRHQQAADFGVAEAERT